MKFSNPLLINAASILLMASQQRGEPLIMPLHRPGNDHGLEPGESEINESLEVRPSASAVVLAAVATADEIQELTDLLIKWQTGRKAKHT